MEKDLDLFPGLALGNGVLYNKYRSVLSRFWLIDI